MLYLNLGVAAILNVDDRSFSVVPELSYTGFGDVEMRFRLAFAEGAANTEYGEKQVERRAELRLRWFF